jgi:hypothetical protein
MHPGLSNESLTDTPSTSEQWKSESHQGRELMVRTSLEMLNVPVTLVNVGSRTVTVKLESSHSIGADGAMLMQLESDLEAILETPIELYCETHSDEVQSRVKRDQILDWVKRREETKQLGEQP